MKHRALFLDRDDTLVHDSGYMSDPTALRLIAGTGEALARLQAASLRLVVISNQSGVARGLVTPDQVAAIQQRLVQMLPEIQFDGFEYCFHHPDEDCGCRKPSPAMILRAADRLQLDLSRSVMVGDKESDVAAGNAAGCWTVRLAPEAVDTRADHVAPDLTRAADWILQLGDRPKGR